MRQALVGRSGFIGRPPQPRIGGAEGGAARGTRSPVASLPAPIGGWNARDALPSMAPQDAITLDNFIPDTGGVRLREGYAEYADGPVGAVESLMTYSPPSGVEEMFAAAGTDIFDVTDPGTAASVLSGLNSDRWQHSMFATTGGNFLFAVNGVDDARHYNGTSWTAPVITGVLSANLVNVARHASRLWFCENNSLDAWYLPTASVAGAASKLSLGPLCQLGGYLLAIASWTRDGGAGMDDLWVGITNKGEAVIFSGTDPSSASTWQKVGTFRIPEPVGRRCVVQIGADLGLITSQGVLPLSAIMPLAASGAAKVAATDKISGAIASAYNGASASFGWQLIEYPKGRLLILNVPIAEASTSHQYVMNTQTGGWCRFKGLNAGCWALKGDDLFFGGVDGKIYQYGNGVTADLGQEINAVSIGAYNNLGSIQNKKVQMIRPMFTGPDGYSPLLAVRADYDASPINYVATTQAAAGELWDEAEWDDAEWALSIVSSAKWQSVHASGAVLSVAFAVNVADQFQFNAIDIMHERGGYL